MENLGIQKLTEELQRINPCIDIFFVESTYPATIIAVCSDCAKLNLPVGYYYNEKNELTNTSSGTYESFNLMTQYEYLSMLA